MSSGELTVMFRRTPDVSAKGNHAFGNLVRQMNHVRQTTCVGVSDTPTPTPSYRGTMVIKGVRQFHLVTPYEWLSVIRMRLAQHLLYTPILYFTV